jgi:hypothetical protein
MEWIRGGRIFTERYNCTVYDYNEIPGAERRHPLFGSVFLLGYVFFVVSLLHFWRSIFLLFFQVPEHPVRAGAWTSGVPA